MNDRKRGLISSDHFWGPLQREDPTTKQIVDAIEAADVGGGGGQGVETYLRDNPDVARAVRTGLAETRRLERAHSAGGQTVDLVDRCTKYEAVLPVQVPPLRVAAATVDDPSPFPEDHRVLVDDARGLRVSYFRRAGRACVGFFLRDPQRCRVTACQLDNERFAVPPGVAETTIELAHASQIVGKQLSFALQIDGEQVTVRYTVIAEGGTQ